MSFSFRTAGTTTHSTFERTIMKRLGFAFLTFVFLLCISLPALSQIKAVKEKSGSSDRRRFCLALDLKEDSTLIREYKYWHMSEHIWPEIPRGIREVGILDMEIYLLGSRLFMIMETTKDFDFEKQMGKLAGLPRQKEWEAFVSKFQKSSANATSSEKWKRMDRIFKLP
jgi:L-rhamnose mutarotase